MISKERKGLCAVLCMDAPLNVGRGAQSLSRVAVI